MIAVRELTRIRKSGIFPLTSDLWEFLVQEPEALVEGILSIILGNLVRLTEEEVLPVPFELLKCDVIHGSGN